MLRTNWMGSLEGHANEAIDNDVIQDYLDDRPGLLHVRRRPGRRNQAGTPGLPDGARRRSPGGAQIESLYRREMKLDELTRRLLNKHGRISAQDKVTVDGKVYPCPGMTGGKVGDEVVVTFVWPRQHLLDPGINKDRLYDNDYDLMATSSRRWRTHADRLQAQTWRAGPARSCLLGYGLAAREPSESAIG